MAKLLLEEVFVTEGIPQFTFVPPPNFNDILLDVRKPGKPVIIEGQSGTGKTTCVIKAIEKLGSDFNVSKWKARKAEDVASIVRLVAKPEPGVFLIDDFHRLDAGLQASLADMAKLSAEEGSDNPNVPKLILVGINQVGSELISLVPDIAKRVAIHRIKVGLPDDIQKLVERGAELLNIQIPDWQRIYHESAGDYWLTQHLCQTLCSIQNVTETQAEVMRLVPDFDRLRESY
jgi:Holliday junction resolvasome RuvABC ATP-dependent DNA helicase subunit